MTVAPPAGSTDSPVTVVVPRTATVSSGSSMLSSTGTSVNVPISLVMPAGIVIVKFATAAKSVVNVAVSAATETATSVGSLRADPSSAAVTVTIRSPPVASSGMLAGATLSVSVVEAASSSVMVRVCGSGPVTPTVFVAMPETVTVLSAASTLLFAAVIVTVPELVVSPAVIVRVVPLSEKSAATAGMTGTAEITMVVTTLDGVSSVAVTVLVPAFSGIEAGLSTSVTVGVTATRTVAVGALSRLSSLPPSSVKLTRTFSTLPASSSVSS